MRSPVPRLTLGLAGLLLTSPVPVQSTDVQAPGKELTTTSSLLGAGAELTQDLAPIEQINMYLDGFHFAADDMGEQMEAHHFCTQLNEEMHQCPLYDGNGEDAKLVGVEYIVSKRLFEQLPEEEKKLWHSHHYEVKSGQLAMPGVPGPAEHAAMEKLASTYGKTWHTWQTNQDDRLPLGIPQLMMGFTEDGQIQPQMLQARDQRMGISTGEKRESRADITMPTVADGANAWQDGESVQLRTEQVQVANLASKEAQQTAQSE